MAITKAELQLQLQAVLRELEQQKANYHHLQLEITKHEIANKLCQQKNHWSQRDNEELKKMLSDKDGEISQLKNHNQDLEDKIKRSKNDKDKPLQKQ